MGVQLNIGQETLRGLLAHWSTQRRAKSVAPTTPNGDVSPSLNSGAGEHGSNRRTGLDDNKHEPSVQQTRVLPSFEFSTQSPPSIITEGSQVKIFIYSIQDFVIWVSYQHMLLLELNIVTE